MTQNINRACCPELRCWLHTSMTELGSILIYTHPQYETLGNNHGGQGDSSRKVRFQAWLPRAAAACQRLGNGRLQLCTWEPAGLESDV